MKKLILIAIPILMLTGCSKGFTEKELTIANQMCKDDGRILTRVEKEGTANFTLYTITCKS